MTHLNAKGVTPKSLPTMCGLVNPGFRGNGAGYFNELVDSMRFCSDEGPVEVKEFINGKWVYIQTL